MLNECPICGLQLKVAKIENGKRYLKCVNPQCANEGKSVLVQNMDDTENINDKKGDKQ